MIEEDTLLFKIVDINGFQVGEFDSFTTYEINYLQDSFSDLHMSYLDIDDLNSVYRISVNNICINFTIIKYFDEWYDVRINNFYYRCDTFEGFRNLLNDYDVKFPTWEGLRKYRRSIEGGKIK